MEKSQIELLHLWTHLGFEPKTPECKSGMIASFTNGPYKNIQRPNGVKTLGYFFLSLPINRASDSVPFPNLQPFTLECF